MLGELLYGTGSCVLDPDQMYFDNSEVFSQMVFSESAFQCLLDNFFTSPIGKLHLNTPKTNALFERNDIQLNTSWLNERKIMSFFYNKLGPNKEISFELEFEKPTVLMGQKNVDLAVEYVINFRAFHMPENNGSLNMQNPLLIEDHLSAITSMNIETQNDIMFIHIVEHKLNINQKYGQKSQPTRNNMKLTENDYKDFLSSFEITMNYLKTFLNEVHFRDGQPFPYGLEEFNSTVAFQPH
jgi:hypothetical protein